MPIKTHIIPSLGLIFSRYSGTVELSEVYAAFQSNIDHIDYVPGMPELLDFSDVQRFEIDFGTAGAFLAKTIEFYRKLDSPVHKSVFAPEDLAYGMARMYQTKASLSEHAPIFTIHKEFGQALAALGGSPVDLMGWLRDHGGYVDFIAKVEHVARRPA